MFASNVKERLMNILGLGLDARENQNIPNQIDFDEPAAHFEEEFDISPVSIIYINSSWEIEKLNMAAAHMFGAQTGSLQGRPFLALVDTQSAESFLNEIHNALATGQKQTAQLKFRKIHGEAFPGECEMIPVFDDHGKLWHYHTVISDMTPAMHATEIGY